MSFRYAPVSIAGTTVGKACAPVALVLAIFVLLTTASAAAAADPTGAVAPEGATAPAGQPLDDHELSILNAADEAILAMKLERAHQIEVASATSDAAFAAQATSIDSLHTYARQQANGYYCGPASVQVAVNFTWNIFHAGTSGTGTTNNKYTQAQLASVMGTTTAGTTGANIAIGLNQRAVRPPGFTYYYTTTGTGAQWHAKVVEGIGSWRMPLLVPVRPHEPGASYRLTSWPTAISAVHWIMIRGYNGAWDGSRTPLVYYNDSSAGYWGGTGSYSDPSYDVHYVNALNTGKLVW